MGDRNSIFVGNKYKSVSLNDISFLSDIIEICSVKVIIGNEPILVRRIFRPPDKAKLPQFDAVLSDVLTRSGENECGFLAGDSFRYFKF